MQITCYFVRTTYHSPFSSRFSSRTTLRFTCDFMVFVVRVTPKPGDRGYTPTIRHSDLNTESGQSRHSVPKWRFQLPNHYVRYIPHTIHLNIVVKIANHGSSFVGVS